MSEELKPCPWCGKTASIITNTVQMDGRIVHADYQTRHMCDVFGLMISRYYGTEADAIAAWNRRTES